jgi:glycosyltransferase involved in cell wall biosynthesis
MNASATHLLLIPSYNSGDLVVQTVREARRFWSPVWVVVDGSTDGSEQALQRLCTQDPALRVLSLPRNCGKGAAILHGLRIAMAEGFTHVLTMDADGQHPADCIPDFMATSAQNTDAMILGQPVFDASAPALRVKGRKVSNWWVNLETLNAGIADSLFGFRVYPIAPLVRVMDAVTWMRRFDFEPEAAVRLCWKGVGIINLPAPVRYLTTAEGGVSHFHYVRDNILLVFMHVRLVLGTLPRLPWLIWRRYRSDKRIRTNPL